MHKYPVLCAFLLALSACSAPAPKPENIDALQLYRDITQGKSQLQMRTGEPTQFSKSEKICITAKCKDGDTGCKATDHYNGSPLMAGSDYQKYYELSGEDSAGYWHYGDHSAYAQDVQALTANMDRLMASFRHTGLLDELARRGKTPALMFDIDNTLEFSAGPDSDNKGDGPAIQGVVDFAKRWCFKDGLDCYFITARYCTVDNVAPTAKWLKANLQLDEEKLRRYVYFSNNAQNLSCQAAGSPTIAYKDVIREALEQQRNVFWLMSIGDQLTDSLGEHSGMKVRVPNQFFHSDVAPNQDAPWGVGQCGSPTTIAPPRDCAAKLVPAAIQYTNLEYCRSQAGSQ